MLTQNTFSARGWSYRLEDGTVIIDLAGGNAGEISLGHNWPGALVSEAPIHCGPLGHRHVERLQGAMCDLYPQMNTWRFTHSRTEAVEMALRCVFAFREQLVGALARRVIYVDDGEHGGSITTEQFSEPNAHFRAPFQTCPLSPDILTGDIVPDILLREYDAIIYEPVQRRTGLALGYEVMERIKSLSEQIGAFVIVDESATSFARCGITGFISGAHHHADIVIASESLGQGLPLCALGHASGYEDCYKPPRGWPSISPRAAQVGLNVIETIKQGHGSELCLAQRSYNMGMLVIETFKDWNVRVTGSMIHIHVGDATRAALELRKAGILVNHFGPWIILTPHLIMSLVDFGHTLTKMLEVLDG